MKDVQPRGALELWCNSAALAASLNPHWCIGLCSGFAGTLLDLAGLPTCGLALTGRSSMGKTTAQQGAASVWGNPRPGRGLLHPMNSTLNAMENLIGLSSGTTFQADELGQADQRELARSIFNIAAGSGRARQRSDSELRANLTWTTFVVFSSERGLADIVEQGGHKWLAGHSARILDVDVSQGVETVTQDQMASINAWRLNYGHAGPLFVQYLFSAGWTEEPERIGRELDRRASVLCGDGGEPATLRAARTLSVVWLGGDLAQEAGLLPASLDIEGPIRWAWGSFRSSTEADALDPIERSIMQLRQSIATRMSVDIIDVSNRDEARREIVAWYDEDRIYVPRNRLGMLAGGTNKPQALLKALQARGMLDRPADRLYHDYVPKVGGGLQHYRLLRRTLLGDAESN
jgi:uncharacterized protein DUF927